MIPMDEGSENSSPGEDESKSSLIFIQLLLLAPPILTAPIIFTAGNIGDDYGIDLLILSVIGLEFAVLAVFGIQRSSIKNNSMDEKMEKELTEEFELSCPHCKGIFPILITPGNIKSAMTERCTFCGEESSLQLPLV